VRNPPTKGKKLRLAQFRLTSAEYRSAVAMARRAGLSFSAFVGMVLRQHARVEAELAARAEADRAATAKHLVERARAERPDSFAREFADGGADAFPKGAPDHVPAGRAA
jgi:hypothetical protein